jgi:acyl-CoA thioester hydrolase
MSDGSKQPSSGWVEGATHYLPLRVYYEDTDFTGVVYHGSYVRFLERGRTEALRRLGADHQSLGSRDDPLAFAIRRLNIEFLKPARIDDALVVRTSYEEFSGARILARQEIYRAEELLLRAQVEVACVSREGRPRRLPAEMKEALRRALIATQGAQETS